MNRCLQLARLGEGAVAPNPMVGSVLVHAGRIIGEGFHRQYGEAHAEVNCLQSIAPEDIPFIESATLYVSLEPCAHFGKTPPCADLILQKNIKKVVIGCRDPFLQVNGKGIEKLQSAGVEVISGILEEECKALNKRFFTFHTKHRPFILLKWAQTTDGKIANEDYSRVMISNAYTNRLVHHWRSQQMAILVGTNTALFDDPELTTRLWPGKNPIRLIVDMDLRLPKSLKIFNGTVPTIIFNRHQHNIENVKSPEWEHGVLYYQVTEDVNIVHQITNALFQMNIQSLMVEGGAKLLQTFIEEGVWDEANVITNEQLVLGSGLAAPVLSNHEIVHKEFFHSDVIRTYRNLHN